ncbi:DUF3558 family protein [Mycobacteroides abscessus]|uniref:DUF3558 family protein n=2 Tax=Mycobacteroides abscessus TaxID=36809 RepID=UPI0009283DC2|nr:DUF3558 family protein [Mycobacteroides abscessus]SIE16658.1 Protein of uncharacterised function (DUF3558) [Mycobacteroides abscessus subsp. abscessus]SLC83859.1 Protein of uncharacterised function (DUF3558) [Mycobacteroides abscessus subsp. massiliense]SLJ57701.1 Protein of uncharacterised function (DUF3558) [Mycobacteroides abscessus subsp. abscessus]
MGKLKWIMVAGAAASLVGGCAQDGIRSAATAETATGSPLSSATSVTTATADNNPVKGTTFDACTAITDTDVATWNVDPANKRDAHKTAFGQRVRGCIWGGPDWFIKIYAVDTSMTQLAQPNDRWDRHEPVAVGARSGWLIHGTNGISCSVTIPSQQAVATVQIDLKLDLTEQRYNQCPLALRIIRQIEPKIP